MIQERVGIGHPDKICDLIAEIVKHYLISIDRNAKTAIEVVAYMDLDDTFSIIKIFGEIALHSPFDPQILNRQIRKHLIVTFRNLISYSYYKYLNPKFDISLTKQSIEIANRADKGAGDQGIIISEYNEDIEDFFSKTEIIKNKLDNLDYIGKDWKFIANGINKTFILNFHLPKYIVAGNDYDSFSNVVIVRLQNLIKEVYPNYKIIINKPYKKGSIRSDSGLTGRKIFCDLPFGYQWGGGAVWGKDVSKVDFSALLFTRRLVKDFAEIYNSKNVKLIIVYNIGKDEAVAFDLKINNESFDYPKLNELLKVSNIKKFVLENCIMNSIKLPKILKEDLNVDWGTS